MRWSLVLIALLLPFQASALEYRNLSLLYTDAPFTPADAAGISLLTSLNAIQGNPDGTFRPNRTLNRAEFLKIAVASSPKVRVSSSDAANCFPDVSRDDWFAKYVCLAKKRGMISGYPDGEFKPGRTVNYAEALKILGELYDYIAYSADDEPWYAGYVRAATFHKTALPSSIKFDRPLTRGQMARLAAAFRANEEEDLATYRLSEKSLNLVIAKEIAEKKQEQHPSTGADETEPLPSTGAEDEIEEIDDMPVHVFPTKSRFLLLGSREVIANGLFSPRSESVRIENATIQFRTEPKNIRSVFLTDAQGTRIAELSPDTFDQSDRTWKSNAAEDIEYTIPLTGKMLGVEAVLQDVHVGFPEELIHVKWMSMNVSPIGQETSYQIIATDTAYPPHQTTKARVTSVTNNRPPIIDIGEGETVLLGEFIIAGEHLEGAQLQLNHLTFTIAQKRGVLLSKFSLGAIHSTQTLPCSLQGSSHINCLNIPAALGMIEDQSVIVQLWGVLEIDETVSDPRLQIDLQDPGRISTSIEPGTMGHLRWNDGQGSYNWIELEEPIAEGSVWK